MSKRDRIVWSRQALADLAELRAWLSTLPRGEPARTIGRVRAETERLLALGDVGRPGRKPNQRKVSLTESSYVIIYEPRATCFRIVAVFHAAQNRPQD